MNTVIDLAHQLIARPSVTPDDAGCQKIIRDRLEVLGFHCEAMRFGEVENLWARYGHHSPLIVFAGHTDVVPSGPESEWTSPPFHPEIRDQYLYGRGVVDMKGAIAAMVVAVENLIKNKPDFPGSIAFLLTSDEEGPAINGTAKVIETLIQKKINIDYCIIGEPSSDQQVGDQIRIGRRGSLHCKIKIYGKQGHVAHPHAAINPIHSSALALHELATTEWDQGNESYPPTTFQISNIHSGTGAANVIPGHLDLLCNFRFSTAVTVKQLQERTEAILKKYELKYETEWNASAQPFLTKKGNLISITQKAIKDITGLTTRLSTGGGTSDGRFIASTGAEIIELGVSHATAHHIDECAPVNDLEMLSKIYYSILCHLSNSTDSKKFKS